MNQIKIEYLTGATPLDPNELNGLIPDYITTQGELNTLERKNILEATKWATGKKHSDYLNISFCFNLHKRMFKDVWSWAGRTRTSEKSIGVFKEQILPQLKNLFDDVGYWLKHNTYIKEEIAVRFHHKLVSIHAFPNGNGRHARLMTDVLIEQIGENTFTWGGNLHQEITETENQTRTQYISSLHEADKNNYVPLLKFVKS